jgi:hypothetical protein
MISIGASTNQSYSVLSQGTTTTWVSSLSSLVSTSVVIMNTNGQNQYVITSVSTISSIYLTTNTGKSWSVISGTTGLPTAVSTTYTCGSFSVSGQYGILGTSAGYSYITNTYGNTFINTNPSQTPYIYLPFEQSTTDAMGHSSITATSVSYVTGNIGSYAVNLVNSPGGSLASSSIRGTWTPGSAFTFSFWFNIQSLTGYVQYITSAFGTPVYGTPSGFFIYVTSSNTLALSLGGTTVATTSYTITKNTWYNVCASYQQNGTGYFYVNNALVGSYTCPSSLGTSSGYFTIGGADSTYAGYSYNGYIDDFRIFNVASSIPYTTPPNSNLLPYSYATISGNGAYMLATSTGGGAYKSSNYGITWTQITSVILSGIWVGAAISTSGKYMLLCGGIDMNNIRLYYSINYGVSWTMLSALFGYNPCITVSGSGEYAITALSVSATVAICPNYFQRFIQNYDGIIATFFPALQVTTNYAINAAMSFTGMYSVIVTNNISGANVYYSINYGSSYTGITIGSSPMVSCAISYDGSYITVANATTVYTLNNNSNGYSVAIGNQAGQVNQGQNAIAIGSQAGQINQSANSIILNASGSAVPSYYAGLYVSPLSNYSTSLSNSFSILGYGTDNQIVQGLGTISYNSLYLGSNVTTTPSAINEIVVGSNTTGNGSNTVTLGNISSIAVCVYGVLTPSYTTLSTISNNQVGYTLTATVSSTSGTTNFASISIGPGVWLVTYLIFFSSTANTTITVLPTNASYPIVVGSTTSVATGTYTYPSTGSATLGLQVATSASITVANSYHTATRIA